MMVRTFTTPDGYADFVNNAAYPIEVVSVVEFGGRLVVTFKRS